MELAEKNVPFENEGEGHTDKAESIEANNVDQIKTDSPGINLANEFSKKTDKDILKEKNLDNGISGLEEQKMPGQTNISTVNSVLTNHHLVAKMTVSAVNVGMGMLLQFISQDWTEAGEKRYTLSPTRKAELLEPLTLMLEDSKRKYNPVLILVITVIITYVPLMINAFRYRSEAMAKKRKLLYSKDKLDLIKKKLEEAEAEEKNEITITGEQKKTEPKKKDVSDAKIVSDDGKKLYSIEEISARIKEIKAKKGRRNEADTAFMKQFGNI